MDDMSVNRLSEFREQREKGMEGKFNKETLKTLTANNRATASEQLFAKFKESNSMMNISQVWNGSLSSLMSCDNLTENLVTESIKELEKALSESQRLLSERDKNILELRQALEDCKITMTTDVDKQEKLLKELEKSHKKILDLENQLSEQKRKGTEETKKNEKSNQQVINVSDTTYPECTCYCGSVCNALREINEVKRKLEQTEKKYTNLKRKIRERRKAEADAHRDSTRMTVNERSPGCIIQ